MKVLRDIRYILCSYLLEWALDVLPETSRYRLELAELHVKIVRESLEAV